MKRILLFLAVFCTLSQLKAATYNFTGGLFGLGTDFNTASNWDGGVVPGPGDIAIISGSGFQVVISASVTVETLTVASGADLTIDAAATVTIDGSNVDHGFETTGTSNVIVNNGTIIITNTVGQNALNSKGDFTNNGTITIDGGTGSNLIYVQDGFFTNGALGMITLTNQTNSGGEYIRTDDNGASIGTFTNDGTITITMTGGDEGIYINDNSIFNNNGTINLDGAVGGDYAVRIEDGGTINNNAGSNFNVTASGDDSFQIQATGTVNNAGTILVTDAGTGAGSNSSSDHAMLVEVGGTFNNLTGGLYKVVDSESDGIRNKGTFTNAGTIAFDGFGGDSVENEGTVSYLAGSVLDIGCPGVITEMELKCDHDLGPSCINFDITGGGPDNSETGKGSTYDFIENYGGSSCSSDDLTISAATAKLNFGYSAAVGDCYTIVDGSGLVVGQFASVILSDPSLVYEVQYDQPNEVEVCITAILPVELLNFTGQATQRGSQLNWETATEVNNEGFDVERSTDGINWTSIAFVEGNGNSTETNAYAYLDESPVNGANYYRLKQNDFDGNFDYSHTIRVNFEKEENTFTPYPNPVDDVLFIDMNEGLEDAEVSVIDSNGRLLWKRTGVITKIPFADFNPGVYFISVVNQGERNIQKIIKK